VNPKAEWRNLSFLLKPLLSHAFPPAEMLLFFFLVSDHISFQFLEVASCHPASAPPPVFPHFQVNLQARTPLHFFLSSQIGSAFVFHQWYTACRKIGPFFFRTFPELTFSLSALRRVCDPFLKVGFRGASSLRESPPFDHARLVSASPVFFCLMSQRGSFIMMLLEQCPSTLPSFPF